MQEGKKELKNFQNLLPHVDHNFFQLMIEKSSQKFIKNKLVHAISFWVS